VVAERVLDLIMLARVQSGVKRGFPVYPAVAKPGTFRQAYGFESGFSMDGRSCTPLDLAAEKPGKTSSFARPLE